MPEYAHHPDGNPIGRRTPLVDRPGLAGTPTPSVDRARFRRNAVAGLAAAAMTMVAITAAPAHAAPPPAAPAASLHAAGEPVTAESIREVDGYLIGSDPNFIGVIPSSGVCSWTFNVAGDQAGTMYSALTCSGPRGRTDALVATNPAAGCNDPRVCEFLDRSSIVWR